MSVVIITGSNGLVGSESIKYFSNKFDTVIGIDNNLRKYFFGEDGSTLWKLKLLKQKYANFIHYNIDIRDQEALNQLFQKYSNDISLIIHAAAQPSHDWAANEPLTDFSVNAVGTLNLLELTRKYCKNSVFIFLSTNKVYGDKPNLLPIIEKNTRWELDTSHPYAKNGIDETMSIDQTLHSVFGASKVGADIMVQEYGKYFNLKTGVFRAGCLTGPAHSGAKLHGFLAYLVKCAIQGKEYTIFGYMGKQVRDNLHSSDLVNMFWHFYNNPRNGTVYNIGGSRHSNCSVIEAINIIENKIGKKMKTKISKKNRLGDHIWWITNINKFKSHYPEWEYQYDIEKIISDIIANNKVK